MDVIALAQHGISNATATLGTATSKPTWNASTGCAGRWCSVSMATRRAARRRSALEAALPCMEDGRQARFLFLPEGEDPDTVVRGGGAAHFQELVSNAMPLEQFLFESGGAGPGHRQHGWQGAPEQTGPALYPATARGRVPAADVPGPGPGAPGWTWPA